MPIILHKNIDSKTQLVVWEMNETVSELQSFGIRVNDDIKSKKNYNKLIKVNKKIKHEKLFRRDYKYDFMIPINYNSKRTKLGRGSAIFLHLTKNFSSTLGCVAIKKKDFLILLKLINKNTKIRLT